MGLSPEVGFVEGGVGVFNVAQPDVLAVTVDGVFACVAGPHESLGVKDDGLEFEHWLLWSRAGNRFLGGFES